MEEIALQSIWNLGIRHSTGKPERKEGLYVVGVNGGVMLRSPFKK
jgi:hypothetical protein